MKTAFLQHTVGQMFEAIGVLKNKQLMRQFLNMVTRSAETRRSISQTA
jgi:hypothetical protein